MTTKTMTGKKTTTRKITTISSTAEPAITKPAITEPAITKPVISEPAINEPAITEPAITEPAITEPAITEPVISESMTIEPVTVEPTTSQPTTSQPTTSQPTTSQLTTSEQVPSVVPRPKFIKLDEQLAIIDQIRKKVKDEYFEKCKDSVDSETNTRYRLERQLTVYTNSCFMANECLKEKGYIIIERLTIQEWQKFFSDIFNNYLTENPDASSSTTINEILTDDQYRKLSNVINIVDKETQQNLYTFEIHNLFQKDFKFPPHRPSHLNRTVQSK